MLTIKMTAGKKNAQCVLCWSFVQLRKTATPTNIAALQQLLFFTIIFVVPWEHSA